MSPTSYRAAPPRVNRKNLLLRKEVVKLSCKKFTKSLETVHQHTDIPCILHQILGTQPPPERRPGPGADAHREQMPGAREARGGDVSRGYMVAPAGGGRPPGDTGQEQRAAARGPGVNSGYAGGLARAPAEIGRGLWIGVVLMPGTSHTGRAGRWYAASAVCAAGVANTGRAQVLAWGSAACF